MIVADNQPDGRTDTVSLSRWPLPTFRYTIHTYMALGNVGRDNSQDYWYHILLVHPLQPSSHVGYGPLGVRTS